MTGARLTEEYNESTVEALKVSKEKKEKITKVYGSPAEPSEQIVSKSKIKEFSGTAMIEIDGKAVRVVTADALVQVMKVLDELMRTNKHLLNRVTRLESTVNKLLTQRKPNGRTE